jgi:hypothetical protein
MFNITWLLFSLVGSNKNYRFQNIDFYGGGVYASFALKLTYCSSLARIGWVVLVFCLPKGRKN